MQKETRPHEGAAHNRHSFSAESSTNQKRNALLSQSVAQSANQMKGAPHGLSATKQHPIRWAIDYARIEWACIPIKSDDKRPPLLQKWQESATADEAMIVQWMRKYPRANIGIHCGKSGIVVIDVDPRNGGDATLARLEAAHGSAWDWGGLEQHTPSGGRHYIFKAPADRTLPEKNALGPGIDLLYGDHYFMVAPSCRENGEYRWERGMSPIEGEAWETAAVLPDWIWASGSPEAISEVDGDDLFGDFSRPWPDNELHRRTLDAALTAIGNPPQDRDTWLRLIFAISQTGLPCAKEVAREWSKLDGTKYNERDFETAWASDKRPRGARVGPGTLIEMAKRTGRFIDPRVTPDVGRPDGGREDATDAGNANRMIRLADGSLAYVPELKEFRAWDGCAWQTKDAAAAQAHNLALAVGESWSDEAKEDEAKGDHAPDEASRKATLAVAKGKRDWARYCRSKKGLSSMIDLAPKDMRLLVPAGKWDADPHLMGVANGVVDLRTGEVRPVARDDRVTKGSPYPYDPNAQCPLWEQTIAEATGIPDGKGYIPRPEQAQYLQRYYGYACTGLTREHVIAVHTGGGANCKSVIADTITHVMGTYAMPITTDVMMASATDSAGDRPMPMIAALNGIRLAIASESREHARLDVAMVKRHTGGGYLTARGNYQSPVTFEMTHKLVLLTNHPPEMDNVDEAIAGRVHVVPFDRTWNRPSHPNPDPELPDGDPELSAKLRAEGPGILRWLIQGAAEYFAHGLTPPEGVIRKTTAYLAKQGHMGKWLDDYQRCPASEGTMAAELFAQFQKWGAAQGITRLSPSTAQAFGRELKALGIERKNVRAGVRWGLQLDTYL